MARYFIQLSYDGTNYHGWQVQPNAVTIQSTLNNALSTLLRTPIETTGCGRTDTGVHAKMYYAHFDFPSTIAIDSRLIRSLNGILPMDIAIQQLFQVSDEAHARFDAVSRQYEYHITTVKDPFLRQWACYWPYELDIDKMNEACSLLLKQHDFSCFCKGLTDEQSTICKVTEAKWFSNSNRLIFSITANRFLRNMVRAITGTLLELGENKLSLDDFISIMESGSRSDAGSSVPAHGLYLTRIEYPFVKQ